MGVVVPRVGKIPDSRLIRLFPKGLPVPNRLYGPPGGLPARRVLDARFAPLLPAAIKGAAGGTER